MAAGVRRIEALTGEGALHEHQARRAALRQVLSTLSVGEDQAVDAIAKLQAEAKRLGREVQELKVKAALGGSATAGADGAEAPRDIGGVSFVVPHGQGLDREALRQLSDRTSDRLKTGGVVLVSAGPENRVTMVVVGDGGSEGALPRREYREGAGAARRRQGRRASRFCRGRRLGSGRN